MVVLLDHDVPIQQSVRHDLVQESVPYYQEFDKEKDGYSSSALPLLTRWTKWDHARSKWAYVPTGASVSLALSSTLPPWSKR
jgi:hypothetical protein